MYCQSCDLEVVGREQNTCPLCKATLIESIAINDLDDNNLEEHAKINELIEDINVKLAQSLAEEEMTGAEDKEGIQLSVGPDEIQSVDAQTEGQKRLDSQNAYSLSHDEKPNDAGMQTINFNLEKEFSQEHESSSEIKKIDEILREKLKDFNPTLDSGSARPKQHIIRKITVIAGLLLLVAIIGGAGYLSYFHFSPFSTSKNQAVPSEKMIPLLQPQKAQETLIKLQKILAPERKEQEPFAVKTTSPEKSRKGRLSVINEAFKDAGSKARIPANKEEAVAATIYSVLIESFKLRRTAQAEIKRLQRKGYPAYVESIDLGRTGVWYRIKIGRFKTKADALRLAKKIENSEGIKPVILEKRNPGQ